MTKQEQKKAKAKKPPKKKKVAPVREAAEKKDGGGLLAESRAAPHPDDIDRDAPLRRLDEEVRRIEEEGAPQSA